MYIHRGISCSLTQFLKWMKLSRLLQQKRASCLGTFMRTPEMDLLLGKWAFYIMTEVIL